VTGGMERPVIRGSSREETWGSSREQTGARVLAIVPSQLATVLVRGAYLKCVSSWACLQWAPSQLTSAPSHACKSAVWVFLHPVCFCVLGVWKHDTERHMSGGAFPFTSYTEFVVHQVAIRTLRILQWVLLCAQITANPDRKVGRKPW